MLRTLFQRGISFRSCSPEAFEIAIPLVWGFPKDLDIKSNLFDDEFINSSKIDPSRSLFIEKHEHGRVVLDDDFKELEDYAEKLGTTIVNEKKLKIPINFFLKKFILYATFKNFKIGKLYFLYGISFLGIREIQRIISMIVVEELFLEYFRANVYISRDDYAAAHIIRTAIQNKYGLFNVGLQHSNFMQPKYLPFSAWPYFDRYYIQGDEFVKLWSPYFSYNKSLLSVGTQRDFKILEAREDKLVRSKFDSKYSNSINIIMIITAPSKTYSPESLIKRTYENFWKVLDIDSNLKLILRPRNKEAKESFLRLFPEMHEYLEAGRIVFEETDFTTQELLAFGDIFISEDSSSSILEAVHFNHIYILSINMRYPINPLLKGILYESFEEICHQVKFFVDKNDIPQENKETVRSLQSFYTLPPEKSAFSRLLDNLFIDYLN